MFIEHGSAKNGEIAGTIEDIFGSSTFNGWIMSNTFSFDKQYDKIAGKLSGSMQPIEYMGVIAGNNIRGKYYTAGGEIREFQLEAFDPKKKDIHWMKRV